MTRCPICNAEAAEIDRGLLDGVGFDCKFHGRFRVFRAGRFGGVKRAPRGNSMGQMGQRVRHG